MFFSLVYYQHNILVLLQSLRMCAAWMHEARIQRGGKMGITIFFSWISHLFLDWIRLTSRCCARERKCLSWTKDHTDAINRFVLERTKNTEGHFRVVLLLSISSPYIFCLILFFSFFLLVIKTFDSNFERKLQVFCDKFTFHHNCPTHWWFLNHKLT